MSPRTGIAWIDGRIEDLASARIPVTDHGFLYGDGIFEGMRVYAGRLFRLDAHMTRFLTASKAIGLALPGGIEAVREIVLESVRAYGEDEAYVRLIATRGVGALGVDPTSCPEPRLVCLVDRVALYPLERLRRGIALATSSLRRPPADALDPRVKSLNYLNNALAKLEARKRGADEALLLNACGMVAEASVANVFAHRGGVLLTPPPHDGALEGITRATLLDLAPGLGIPSAERTLGRFDLLGADEVFLCGSGAGLVPVRELDGQSIGLGCPGPIFETLHRAFYRATRELGTPVGTAKPAT